MYQSAYRDILEAAPSESRRLEREALLRAADCLRFAAPKGRGSIEAVEALLYVRRLWTYFAEQAARPDNPLPAELRAKLISIGIWILREEERIRTGESTNFGAIEDICRTIAHGLNA